MGGVLEYGPLRIAGHSAPDWSHHGQDEQRADELPHLKSLRTVGLPKAAIYNKAAGSAIRFAAAIMSAASAGEFAQRRTTTVMRMRG